MVLWHEWQLYPFLDIWALYHTVHGQKYYLQLEHFHGGKIWCLHSLTNHFNWFCAYLWAACGISWSPPISVNFILDNNNLISQRFCWYMGMVELNVWWIEELHTSVVYLMFGVGCHPDMTNRHGLSANTTPFAQKQHQQFHDNNPPEMNLSFDKNHAGLCALGFVLIHKWSNPIDSSICMIALCSDPINIGNCRIKARTQAPTMTYHPASHLTFPPWHHSLIAMFIFTNDGPYHHQCWATSPPRSTSSSGAL